MNRLLFCFVPLLLGGCLAATPEPTLATLAGKVARDGVAQDGVRIAAYPAQSVSLAPPAPFLSPPTVAGRFQLALPPGDYFLLAQGTGVFAYYGRNPVTVPAEGIKELGLGVVATAGAPPPPATYLESGVCGRLLHNGAPLAGATIQIYTDLTSGLKGMGYALAGPTDADGYFEIALPPGTYYLLARKRLATTGTSGPLQAGDFIGYFPGNPLRIAPEAVQALVIPMLEVPEKVERLAGSLFGQTAIAGQIRRADGRLVAGARAVLYGDPQMLNRPLFVSRPTGADGNYVLSFPHGGTYYLAARNTLGGAPGPGDLYGSYDGTPEHALTIEQDRQLHGVDIVVEEMW